MRTLIAVALLSSALVSLPAHAAVGDAAFMTKAAAAKAAANVELQKVLAELTKLTPEARQTVLSGMMEKGLPGLGKGKNLLLALTQLMAAQHADDAAGFRDDVLAVLGTAAENKSYVDAINAKFGKLVEGKKPTARTIDSEAVASNDILGSYVQQEGVEPSGGEQGTDADFGFGDDADGEDVLENPNNLSPNTPVVTKKTNNS